MHTTTERIEMKSSHQLMPTEKKVLTIQQEAAAAFQHVAPFWPLKNLIATNPLLGLEELPFETALTQALSQQANSEHDIWSDINRETIKWCQAYFDEGQATIEMPYRDQGFYACFRQLAPYDKQLKKCAAHQLAFLRALPETPEAALSISLNNLSMREASLSDLLITLITTLPGWASYVKYKQEWCTDKKSDNIEIEYLAIRAIIAYLLWPENASMDEYIKQTPTQATLIENQHISKIKTNEARYQRELLHQISNNLITQQQGANRPDAQLVFCIDVRSETIRSAIEATGNYETFGFAGFFGIAAQIINPLKNSEHASCPVLLTTKHRINENLICDAQITQQLTRKKSRIHSVKRAYQMLKYMFTTPFTLVELMGCWSGAWMLARTIFPRYITAIRENILEFKPDESLFSPDIDANKDTGITANEQISYAETFLRMIGLTTNFAPLVVLCAHGATTENNAYQSSLDCGACGGHNGAPNARILAKILNTQTVREYLSKKNIHIPHNTVFLSALHNTTTDEIAFHHTDAKLKMDDYQSLRRDLHQAQLTANQVRVSMLPNGDCEHVMSHIQRRSMDWAEPRPEWGLARNASFIVGPRSLTKNTELNGRSFLHSYDANLDSDGSLLTTILTAPMVVAQWINCQYLFSTIDNISFGSGSKITHNITGKIGIMQGNASDLMHGLPLQSVAMNDHDEYHEPLRLTTIVYAPRKQLESIISTQKTLQRLFGNAWVHLICIDTQDHKIYQMTPELTWIEKSTTGCNNYV